MSRRRRSSRWIAALALLVCGIAPVRGAGVFRVDDSGTVLSQSVIPMRWRRPAPGRHGDNVVEAKIRVFVRLNLTPWVNQSVRLYMGLAPVTGSPVLAQWRGQGRLQSGSALSGGRALVFDGVVAAGTMEETIELALETDGRALATSENLQFFFEVEPR